MSKSSLIGAIAFVLGGAIGSLVTWKVIEKKYEEKAQEEIDSVKQAYSRRLAAVKQDRPEETVEQVEQQPEEPSNNRPDYTVYSTVTSEELVPDFIPEEKPYIIAPEEFDGVDGYEVIELTYFAGDGVLVDDMGDPVEDPERTVGDDFASHFGEYEEDSVFVRNDKRMCDYQILLDSRRYGEVL